MAGPLPLTLGSFAEDEATSSVSSATPSEGKPSKQASNLSAADEPEEFTKAMVIQKLGKLCRSKDRKAARIVEEAVTALGKMCVGDRSVAEKVSSREKVP